MFFAKNIQFQKSIQLKKNENQNVAIDRIVQRFIHQKRKQERFRQEIAKDQ